MKTRKILLVLIVLFGLYQVKAFPQAFKNTDKARQYFYKLDDTFNLSMVTKDSLYFADYFADEFIDCNPLGVINNRKEKSKPCLNFHFCMLKEQLLSLIFLYIPTNCNLMYY